uniref:Uncharacterized protein n=1 Tax=Steinernema glaseri TaxID=37863 RepID=A0A1I8AL58_9BILA
MGIRRRAEFHHRKGGYITRFPLVFHGIFYANAEQSSLPPIPCYICGTDATGLKLFSPSPSIIELNVYLSSAKGWCRSKGRQEDSKGDLAAFSLHEKK